MLFPDALKCKIVRPRPTNSPGTGEMPQNLRVSIMSTPRKYRLIEFGNRIRASRWHMPYGDQAMFFGVDALAVAGGFPKQNQFT